MGGGTKIGAGVFALPGVVAVGTWSTSSLSHAIGGLVARLAALSLSALATVLPIGDRRSERRPADHTPGAGVRSPNASRSEDTARRRGTDGDGGFHRLINVAGQSRTERALSPG